jgi:hypothetical protein
LSCGSVGKGNQNHHHPPSSSPTDPTLSLSFEHNAGGDYNQLLAVLNRQAGLKPLARQMKPLVPMTPISRPSSTAVANSPIMKKSQSQVEIPLYRRAKAVSMMKEIPKIPLVSFGPSSSASQPSDLYHFDQDQSLTSPSSSSVNSSSSLNNRVKLPRVPSSSRSSGTY